MANPETLSKLIEFLEVTELLDAEERSMFIRVVKRLTSDEDIDTQLRNWSALSVDAVWFKARAADINASIADRRTNMQKKLFGGIEDKSTPKWQVEARLEQDPEWIDVNRKLHIATQLQTVAAMICDIAMQSLRGLEAQGNNARFYGRVEQSPS